MSETAEVVLGTRRYSPTMVTRYALNGHEWEKVEVYEDATVRDNGAGNFLRVPEVMLRAYSNDPTWHDKHDEHFVCTREDHVKHYGKSMEGFVLDCDGDVALYRIMGQVMSHHSYGHASEEFIVQVNYDHDDEEYNGWGDPNKTRIERWVVRLGTIEQIAEALREIED